MKINRAVNSILIGILSVLSCASANAKEYSLWQLYQAASLLDNNYNQAVLQQKITNAVDKQSRADLLPQIKLTANHQWLDNANNHNFNNKQQKRIDLTLEQSLFDANKWNNKKQTANQRQQSQYQLQQATGELILQLTDAYFSLQSAKIQLENIELELNTANQLLALVRSQFKQAQKNSADVNEVLTRLQSIEIQKLQAQHEIKSKLLTLTTFTDIADIEVPKPNTNLYQGLKLLENEQSPKIIELAQQQAPVILNSQAELDNLKLMVSQQKNNFLPKISLNLSQSKLQGIPQIGLNQSNSWYNDRRIGLNFSWQLFNSGADYYRIEEQVQRLQQSQFALAQNQRQVNTNIQQIQDKLATKTKQIDLLERTIKANEHLVKSMQLAYQEGLRNSIDVLDAQQQLHQSKQNLLQTKQQAWMSELELKANANGLTEQDIKILSDFQ